MKIKMRWVERCAGADRRNSWARGPRVMSSYWKDEAGTARHIDKEGWYHTGDMGYVDEDGYFFLVGPQRCYQTGR